MINIGDMVKVIDQDIRGIVVDIYSNRVVIEDEDAETMDNRLEFRIYEIEED
jgi:hypothetical protein